MKKVRVHRGPQWLCSVLEVSRSRWLSSVHAGALDQGSQGNWTGGAEGKSKGDRFKMMPVSFAPPIVRRPWWARARGGDGTWQDLNEGNDKHGVTSTEMKRNMEKRALRWFDV
jgi:hypothetical protein